jgi:hypothetical protein
MISPNLVGHPDHLHHLPDRVDANDVRPGEDGGRRGGRRRPVSIRGRYLSPERLCEK